MVISSGGLVFGVGSTWFLSSCNQNLIAVLLSGLGYHSKQLFERWHLFCINQALRFCFQLGRFDCLGHRISFSGAFYQLYKASREQ
jgi:hypothetical protein